MMKRKLKYTGEIDFWSRPLLVDDQGNWFCDVNLGEGTPDICFKQSKEGEPDFSVDLNKIEIVN